MKTAWTTLRDEEVVDPLTLTDNNFKDQVLRLGHDCEPPLFRHERPKQPEASASRLSIIQEDFARRHGRRRRDRGRHPR